MSKLYVESTVICSCNQIDSSNVLRGIQHKLADLYFCPNCQTTKCHNCCLYNIEGKFCPNCLAQFRSKETHCTKNCFSCPLCTSNLSISVSNGEIDGKKGKQFKFKCTFCEFQYDTELVTKPKPLTSIIREEIRHKDEFTSLFYRFLEYLKDNGKIGSQSISHEPILDDEVVKKLDMLNLSHLTRLNENTRIKTRMKENLAVNLDLEADIKSAKNLAQIKKYSDLDTSNNYRRSNAIYDSKINKNFPIPRKLHTKKSYRCSNCNQYLLLPKVDSLKFEVKFNAVDFTPTINISKLPEPKVLKAGTQCDFLLNFYNPQDSPIIVLISTVPSIKINNCVNGTIALPVPDFTINGVPKVKNFIHSIPTSLLTSNTAISRAENMFRMGKSLSKGQEGNLEESLEAGVNWCLVPVSLVLDDGNLDSSQNRLQIPLFIRVNSILPSSLEGKTNHTELSYSYWSVIDLGEFSLCK